jgi:hypothetical protein
MTDREAYRLALDAVEPHVESLATRPPPALRRAPAQALQAIGDEAERLLRGEIEGDRRRGPGRRAEDYRL